MSKNDVPVLLIGLGGIGSSIVNKTYGRLKKEGEISFLEALVFDTDQNELSKLENIPNECKIQTSTDKSVKYVLDRDEAAKDWFPVHPKILSMQLINGAGQIRAVSRLALRSAMKAGKLNNVQNVKDRIYKLGTNAHEKGVRIMIVTSMMGGTGSGMFLQIPLYLREIFQSKFSADTIEIQGTFLLPDVLKGAIDEKQKTNVYANAYASMKELNAIILYLAGEGNTVELEYKPDQLSDTRDISVKNWPYDYCYIYDKEDTKGRVLSGISDYVEMVSENLYSQVCGPISDRMYSYFVNTIRGQIRKNCRNIFGGLGIGKLIYPYEDICDYITCRAVNENLKEQLLRIDTSFKLKLEQYEKNKNAGNDTEKPILSTHYMDEFDMLANDVQFFKNIKKQIVVEDESGNVEVDKIRDYLDEIDNKIEINAGDFINSNGIEQPNRSKIDNAVEGQLKHIIDEKEDEYKAFRHTVDSRVESMAETQANNDFEIYDDAKESFFDGFLKNEENYINPVGIRYILYNIKDELENAKSELYQSIEDQKDALKKCEDKKMSSTFKNTKDIHEALNYAMKHDNMVDRMTFKSMKKFKDVYAEETTKHYKKLRDYCAAVYKHSYYKRTIEMLNILIQEYEKMFERLDDQKVGLERKIEELLHKHDENLGKTNIYILGSPEFKEEIWNAIPPSMRLNTLSNVLPEKMHEKLKINCKQKIKNLNNNIVEYDYLFNTLILDGCKNSLKNDPSITGMIDMNITQAMVKEFDFSKKLGKLNDVKDQDQYIKERIAQIIDRTQPFAASSDNSSDYSLWGINDNLRLPSESTSDKPRIELNISDLSNSKLESHNICKDATYSKYEIVYLHSRYELLVSDFKKFYAGENGEEDGEYYTCYQKLIKNIVDDKRAFGRDIEITPHIDKRWHKTLLDLNEEVNMKGRKDKAKAFLIGLALKYIDVQEKKISEDRVKLEFLRSLNKTTPTTIVAHGEKVQGNIASLYDALQFNPDIVADIVDDVKNYIKEVKDNTELYLDSKSIYDDKYISKFMDINISCFKNIKNIVDLIIELYSECRNRPEDERNEIFDNIINSLFAIIEDIIKVYYEDDIDIINENSKNILIQLLNNSNLKKSLNIDSDVYKAVVRPIENKIEKYEGR